MMKRAGLFTGFLILALTAVILSGCGGGRTTAPTATPTGAPAEENAALINGEKISFDRDAVHKDLHYKENVGRTESSGLFAFRDIVCRQGEDVVFEIRIVYFENETVEEVMEGTDAVLTDKTVNGIAYQCFEEEFEFSDRTIPGRSYIYCFEGTTYVISFISPYDLTSLETVFMNNVYFEKE